MGVFAARWSACGHSGVYGNTRNFRSLRGLVADEVDTDQCQVVEALRDRCSERFDEVLRGQACMSGSEITQPGKPDVGMLA